MQFLTLKFVCTVLLCSCAIISCALWIGSATVKAPYVEKVSDNGWTESAFTRTEGDKTFDIIATADLQTKWNRWAAGFAAAAAVFQAAVSWITY
jgi:hypothetical protein